jgi:isoleucyl-tRNA synthetase
MRFQPLPPDRPADDVERELLARWKDERLFQQTMDARGGAPTFVFFEGPPTANGRPGIHHVFARTVKDLFCRYRAMKGLRVMRKAGWDTHGLPVEIEVEKQLGISGKQQIEALGVIEFNRRCRESVFTYREEWERLSERIAFWLDYDHPYVTFTNDYIESVWWALKTLFDKNVLYRGHKILPYCPRCETALSSHELALGYADVEDPSVYIALDLESSTRRILVWTTTPWTLVSNAALAVHPDLEYVELARREDTSTQSHGKERDQRTIIIADGRVRAVLGEDYDNRWMIVGRMRGADLVGQRYRRPIDWLEYPSGTNNEVIVGEQFVSADDGTGVVHMSPAFGADDYAAGQRHNLAPLECREPFVRHDEIGGSPEQVLTMTPVRR